MKEFSEIRNEVLEMNISEETDLTFKAACVILYALHNQTWNMRRIHYATGYPHSDVQRICNNLRLNEILSEDYIFQMEDPDSKDAWMEFLLICMAASGEIVRVAPEQCISKEEKSNEQKIIPPPISEVQEFKEIHKALDKATEIERLAKKINRKLIFWEEDVRPLPPIEEEIVMPIQTKEKQEPYVFYIPKLDYQ